MVGRAEGARKGRWNLLTFAEGFGHCGSEARHVEFHAMGFQDASKELEEGGKGGQFSDVEGGGEGKGV